MRKSPFTDQQIVAALRQGEYGTTVGEVCRKLGIAELRRLRAVEDEQCRRKQLVADLTLDKQMLQEVLRKKPVRPAQRRAAHC